MIGWFYYVATTGVRIYYKVLTNWQVEGLENVPKKEPLMVVSNHLSNGDPPLISVSVKRKAIFMAKEELFRSWFFGYFMHRVGAFPVHRGQLDRQAMRDAETVLKNNYVLGMFPEATRSKDARLQEAYPGSAMIALRNKAKIVPAAITGTEKLSGWKWMFKRPTILIRFGEPFYLPDKSRKRSREYLTEATNLIMERIAELLPPEYRGVYGDGKGQDEPAD
jgi:1-acyl-sn-glycerol-3-phosphate acyltransferase